MGPLTRRTFLQGAAAGALALAAGCRRGPSGPPNVLFLSIDDLNDWVQPLKGYRGEQFTPHINRLFKRGMLFTHAYCSSPACNPSRSSLMAGVSPESCGIVSNSEDFRDTLPDVVTLPQYFAAHGYATAAGGKLFHNRFPDVQSWQQYFPEPHLRQPEDRPLNGSMKWKEFHRLPPEERRVDWGPVDYGAPSTPDYQIADWTVEFLARPEFQAADAPPLFLAAGFVAPHLPWYVPRPFFDLYDERKLVLPIVKQDDLDDVPERGRIFVERGLEVIDSPERPQWRRMVHAYLAAISFADAQVGRVLDAWEASPLSRDAVVVLWSDHGFHLGEKTHFRKGTLWEPANRVPLIVQAPGVEPGSRCHRPVSLLDMYPTMVDLCGLPQRPGLEGESFHPQLLDRRAPRLRPAFTSIRSVHWAVRSQRYRYIRYSDGSQEFYDHKRDPNEWNNLASDPEYDEIRREHHQWLTQPERAREQAEGRLRRRAEQEAES